MGGRCEPISRVVRITVGAGAIDHLRDVVDSVELILEISERVSALQML